MYPFPKISLPESCWVSEDGLMIRLRFGSGGIVFCFSWTISRNESVRSMEGIFPDNEKNKNKRQVLLISTRNEYNVQVEAEDRLKLGSCSRGQCTATAFPIAYKRLQNLENPFSSSPRRQQGNIRILVFWLFCGLLCKFLSCCGRWNTLASSFEADGVFCNHRLP